MRPKLSAQSVTPSTPSVGVKIDLNPERVGISIDPGSHSCGISVFTPEGKYITGFCIRVSDGLVATSRLYRLRLKFVEEWEKRFGPNTIATTCTLENLPMSRFAVLSNAAGAILSSGKVAAELPSNAYIVPTKWKAFTRQFKPGVKDPKGLSALKSIGWGFPLTGIGEDVADSILIRLASSWYKQEVIWLSETKWVRSWYIPKKFVSKIKKEKKVKNAK